MQDSVKIDRDRYLGGSDIGVIMNLSPFKSRYDLLLEKAGYKADEFEGNIYTEYGNTLEPIIRDWINTNNPHPFKEGKHVREAEPDELIGVRIHTDGENDDAILEIKTTSQVYESVYDYKLYLVQLLYYMVLTGKPYGLLAVYNRPEDLDETFNPERLQLFNIKLKDYEALVGEISEACENFITDLSKVKANPFITEEELLPSDITEISKRILAFESQIKYMKNIEAQIKSEKTRLKDAMQAAGVKTWTTPSGYKITLIPDGEDEIKNEKYFDEDALKRDKPELFKDETEGGYMKTRLVEKKGRAGYVRITEPKKEG